VPAFRYPASRHEQDRLTERQSPARERRQCELTTARLREVFGQDRALSDADAELLAATACMAPAAGLDAPVRLIWGPTGAAVVLAGRQCPLLSVILRWNVAPGSRP
jgi:hypothetical protein